MPQIRQNFDGQTVICTFDVTPGSAHDVLDLLNAAYAEVISRQRGYIAGAIHLNDAQTRICTYSQWHGRADYQAMLRNPEMRVRNRAIHALVRGFEPVMYEVAAVFAPQPVLDAGEPFAPIIPSHAKAEGGFTS